MSKVEIVNILKTIMYNIIKNIVLYSYRLGIVLFYFYNYELLFIIFPINIQYIKY